MVLAVAELLARTDGSRADRRSRSRSSVWQAQLLIEELGAGVDWRQAENGSTPPGPPHVIVWTNSILQQNNSTYYEGMSVPQRLIFTDIPATANDDHVI